MNILAPDLGKFNTMCCFFDTDSRKYHFLNAATDRKYLETVFKNHSLDLLVIEACGPSGWITILVECAWVSLRYNPRSQGGPTKATRPKPSSRRRAVVKRNDLKGPTAQRNKVNKTTKGVELLT